MSVSTYPYADWAEKNLTVATKTGAEWMCVCNSPSHDDSNPSMRFNVELGVFLCFSCGHRGNVGNPGNLPEYDFDAEMDAVRRKLAAIEEDTGYAERASYVEEGVLSRYRMSHDYWLSRKIKPATQKMFGLGYDFGKDAVTVPVRRMNGQLLGVTHRFLDPETKGGRYHYPFGFQKSKELFGSWLIAKDPDITWAVITEGALDAIRLWQAGIPAMAIYGSMPSREQALMIDQLALSEVVLFMDNDKEGRNATQRCLGWWRDDRRRVIYKPETDFGQYALVSSVEYTLDVKDPGDMTDKQLRKHVDRAPRLL